MLVVTDLRCWFHKFLKFVVPEYGSGYRRKNPRVVEIRPLGAAKVRAPTWRDRNGPLSSVPDLAGSANRRGDHLHLDQFTADCVPVQRSGNVSAISPSRSARSDYEYFR